MAASKTVADDEPGQGQAFVVEQRAQASVVVDPAAARHRQQQQRQAEQRAFQHPAGPDVAHVQADQHGDGNGGGDGRGRPRAVLHGVDHHQSEHGDEDHHDHQRADQRGDAADRAEFVARHLAQAAAVAPGGEEHDGHVLHAAAQHRADQNPQRARQVAELRRQRRADQRAGAGDGGEVVAEHDPFVGGHEVAPVVEALRRRGAGLVQHQHPGGNPGGVKAVGQGVDAGGGGDQPDGVDRLAAVEGDAAQGRSAEYGDGKPPQGLHGVFAHG